VDFGGKIVQLAQEPTNRLAHGRAQAGQKEKGAFAPFTIQVW